MYIYIYICLSHIYIYTYIFPTDMGILLESNPWKSSIGRTVPLPKKCRHLCTYVIYIYIYI